MQLYYIHRLLYHFYSLSNSMENIKIPEAGAGVEHEEVIEHAQHVDHDFFEAEDFGVGDAAHAAQNLQNGGAPAGPDMQNAGAPVAQNVHNDEPPVAQDAQANLQAAIGGLPHFMQQAIIQAAHQMAAGMGYQNPGNGNNVNGPQQYEDVGRS